ncbi:P-loop containing nucleoside triphosphate hydrolase protein [Baffinella frigidus]|nr:P-loop containing nucleoside triphosphate hydrolase protein [Cryptophyta sp. CCMP2293]
MAPRDASKQATADIVANSADLPELRAVRESVKPYIDLIDQIRALGVERDLEGGIPQIAVMGDQSSGKSSVLEALSGVQFPRGPGLVTKCATEVRMRCCKDGQPATFKVSLSWSKPQPAEAGFCSREEIGDKITSLTERLLADRTTRGESASFEKEHAIVVEMQALDVPDLTIIDLPGIVRTAVEGQNASVIEDVRNLLNRYLQQDRTVILAVVPCNVDIATVDIIEMARKADPQGQRTIGVLTKPDLIDEGAEKDVVETLKNAKKPLELGYIMVKNRSPKQIEDGVSLSDARRKEREYFDSHPVFGKEDAALFGVDRLRMRLTEILVERIKFSLPELKEQVDVVLRVTQKSLDALGDPPPEGVRARRRLLREAARIVSRDVRDASKGSYWGILADDEELRMYARFHKASVRFNEAVLKLKPEATVERIKMLVADLRGRELPGMANPAVMRVLMEALVVEACHGIISHRVKGAGKLAAKFKAEPELLTYPDGPKL